jgi:hypothetical protein
MARRLLDLADPLEVRHRRRQVLDADAEERRYRHAEELRQLFERLDLDELAALESVDRRSRYVEAAGDLVRAQSGGEPERLQPIADIVESHRHVER